MAQHMFAYHRHTVCFAPAMGQPPQVRLRLGISYYLPPAGVCVEESFPMLKLCAVLENPQDFQLLADKHPSEPPCLAATCDALVFRPCPAASSDESGRQNSGSTPQMSATVLEEWSLRFCFGPDGYRHTGHGECDGYAAEFRAAGQRRWRPVEHCYAKEGLSDIPFPGLRLLFRARRCDGLLD